MRTIGAVGAIRPVRTVRTIGPVGTINPFASFDTLGELRAFDTRWGFSRARRAACGLLLLPGRMIRALHLLTHDILPDMAKRVLQTAVIRMLCEVS